LQENTVVHERLAGEVGHPSRVSRKGKASPLEGGRGKYSPPASPERVTSGAFERRGDSVLQKLRKLVYLTPPADLTVSGRSPWAFGSPGGEHYEGAGDEMAAKRLVSD